MNNKGQTLILFVIIVPIFIIFLAFVVDIGIIEKEKTKLDSTIKTVLKNTYKDKFNVNYEEKVKNILKENNIPIDNLKIRVSNDIEIENDYKINSIFGNIIGIKDYQIKTKINYKE